MSTYQDHHVGLVVGMQVTDKIGEGAEAGRIISKVFGLVHVVDVIPLDILKSPNHSRHYQ